MSKTPISACIITYNEADHIDDCLTSLAFCDDIVVVDSHSSDDTCERARQHGARVFLRTFEGYRTQKDFAVGNARHDWVLCLDADERVDATLRQAIEDRQARGFDSAAGYAFARLSNYFGGFLRHGNAYPDRVLRLFDRRRGGWHGEREIHESVKLSGPVASLPGNLIHYPYRTFSEQMAKQEKYAHMMAQHLHVRHKKITLARIVFSPLWRFVRGYILRGGFLDGWRGLIYALSRMEYVRRKFIKLWLLQQGQKP